MKLVGNIKLGQSKPYKRVVIQSLLSGSFALTVPRGKEDSPVTIQSDATASNQVFYLIPADKFCILESVETGRVLQINNLSIQDGEILKQGSFLQNYNTNSTSHLWRLVEKEPNSNIYFIMNVNSSKVLDVYENKNVGGTKVIQYRLHNKANQLWRFRIV